MPEAEDCRREQREAKIDGIHHRARKQNVRQTLREPVRLAHTSRLIRDASLTWSEEPAAVRLPPGVSGRESRPATDKSGNQGEETIRIMTAGLDDRGNRPRSHRAR